MSKHVLVTGFEPFGAIRDNPSEIIARRLRGREIAGYTVISEVFPVRTGTPKSLLAALIAEIEPMAIVGLGVAAGRSALAIERTAVNRLDFDNADNGGTIVRNRPIAADGPPTRTSTLPTDLILAQWTAREIPGYVSDDAGTFLCNEWLYEALATADSAGIPAGFIHLPALPSHAVHRGPANTPSMSAELMEKGIVVLIESLALDVSPLSTARLATAMSGAR